MIRRMVKNVRAGWHIELLGGFFKVVDVVAATALKTKVVYLDSFGDRQECVLRSCEYRPVKIPVISPFETGRWSGAQPNLTGLPNDTVQTD